MNISLKISQVASAQLGQGEYAGLGILGPGFYSH